MPHSISLWFDEGSESRIRNIWADIAASGVPSKYHHGPYRPHITLAVYNDLEVKDFSEALRDYSSNRPTFNLSFESLGAFPGSIGALYLPPKPTLRLLETQREVLNILSNFGSGVASPHYKTDSWTPHCTLCVGVTAEDLNRAFELCQRSFEKIDAQVNRIGVIQNPEEIELYQAFFSGQQAAAKT
jgi:2'-5' RNA ligase